MISLEEITARQAQDLAKQRSIVAGFYTMSAVLFIARERRNGSRVFARIQKEGRERGNERGEQRGERRRGTEAHNGALFASVGIGETRIILRDDAVAARKH